MLFGYPDKVTAENWLHKCVLDAVGNIHKSVDAKKRLPKWPGIFPAIHQEKLKKRTGLKNRFADYAKALRALLPNERKRVFDALHAQNKLPELLNCECDCDRLTDLPASMHEPIKSLFEFTFSLLTELQIRHRAYEKLCDHIPALVCPFCGVERLDAPGAPQEDFDHYIPRKDYPFAAANLRNLPPMGGRCNTAYKGIQDPLRKKNGDRRRACDPYASTGVGVSLNSSEINDKTVGPIVAKWAIEFSPTDEKIETWDEIFHVRERWTRDVLDQRTFSQWLGDFRTFCLTAGFQFAGDADIVRAVERFEQNVSGMGIRDLGFLKAAVFRFVANRCESGCQRLLPILRDAVAPPKMVTPNPAP